MIGGGYGNQIARRGARSGDAADVSSFSREQEYQADTLGMRYMIAAGYDPAGAAELLAALAPRNRAGSARAGAHQPPDPRMGEHPPAEPEPHAARDRGSARRPAASARGMRNRDAFLERARRHSCRRRSRRRASSTGRVFTHPDLRIQFRVPTGYLMSNGTYAVTISGSAGQSPVQRRPLQRLARHVHPPCVPASCLSGSGQVADPAAAALDDQRHAARRSTTARVSTDSGADRRQRRRLSVGSAARLSFRDADAGRHRARPVRADGEFAAEDQRRGGGGDPAAHHPCRDGRARATRCSRSQAGWPIATSSSTGS